MPTGQNQTFKYGKLTGSTFYELSPAQYLQSLKNKNKQKEITTPIAGNRSQKH